MPPKILPVIHYPDRATALSEADKAAQCSADGVFLISHHGNDFELLDVGMELRARLPGFPIGINLLSMDAQTAAAQALARGYPMLWGDDMGVDSQGLHAPGRAVATACRATVGQPIQVFASVAFKYRPSEPDPAGAALNAHKAGFIPTTSGSGTGSAPEVAKIKLMSEATNGTLAVASGMTPENVSQYAPYLSHILVATGVSLDEYRLHEGKLRAFIANAK